MERASLETPTKGKQKAVKFFSSGSTILDLALGGGWALPRTFNIVGDKSTGKTLLAIEAFANFRATFPKGRMRYAEAEAAFDEVFAETLGFPDEVERPETMLHTVEEFRDDLYKFADRGGPGLYIIDSLDALSDEAEVKKFQTSMKKKIKASEDGEEDNSKEKGSYGVSKAKKMSELFRLMTQDMEDSDVALGIISQIRDKIGVVFGETKTRSGGHALDYYASQVLWLSEVQKIDKILNGVKRVVGVSILSKVKKLKVGTPFRLAEYDIIFGYGIDDEMSMIDWLLEVKVMVPEAAKEIRKNITEAREKKDFPALVTIKNQLKTDCINVWREIESKMAPPIRKYGNPV